MLLVGAQVETVLPEYSFGIPLVSSQFDFSNLATTLLELLSHPCYYNLGGRHGVHQELVHVVVLVLPLVF